MRHAVVNSFNASEDQIKPTFNLVIVYEDFDSGSQAKFACDLIAADIGCDCQCVSRMWKFDVLAISKLRRIAVRDAQGADIIMLSCRGDTDLPEAVRLWLEEWLLDSPEALALVVLFVAPDADPDRGRVISAYLSEIAGRANVEFFSRPGRWPAKITGLAGEADNNGAQSTMASRTLAAMAEAMERELAIPRWGINE